jgi:hypothetical protein
MNEFHLVPMSSGQHNKPLDPAVALTCPPEN